MKKNDEVIIDIEDMTEGGDGIGRVGAFVLFVKDTVAGDRVRVVVTKLKKTYGYARVLEILCPSPDRVVPPCPISRQCGGCTLQAMSYEAQLRFKEKRVADALERIGGFKVRSEEENGGKEAGEKEGRSDTESGSSVVLEKIIGMDEPLRSRNKAQYPVGIGTDGKAAVGFYAARSHRIVPLPDFDCMIGPEINNKILQVILTHMNEDTIRDDQQGDAKECRKKGVQKIMPYDETTGHGLVRHVLIRQSSATGEIMVCIVINGRRLPDEENLADKLFEIPEMASFCVNINTKNTNVILGDVTRVVRGRGYITERISLKKTSLFAFGRTKDNKTYEYTGEKDNKRINTEMTFKISPESFFQVNPTQTRRLYETALEFASLRGGETVWDLYCGAGTISLFLADAVGEGGVVYGIESVPEAVRDAKENAKSNGIKNTVFIAGKTEDILLAGMISSCPELVLVDPPRKGCDAAVLDTILSVMPQKVVYVSCNPSTLARDLRVLADGGYKIEKVRPVDMFPYSAHTECVVLLSRA